MKKTVIALFLLAVTAVAAAFDFGTPVTRYLNTDTAYQANDPTKAAVLSFSMLCQYPECALEIRIGTAPLDCTGGTVVATYVDGRPRTTPASLYLPIGYSFIMCTTNGAYVVPMPVYDQSAG